MNTDVTIQFERKRRQRFIEYAVLTSIQGFFATALLHETLPIVVVGLGVVAFGLAWNLAFAREHRRTLDIHSAQRLLGDAIESVILMVCIAGGIIIARFWGVPIFQIMAHIAPTIMLYFLGSFIGETIWARQFLATLSLSQQTNYIANLNRSLIFPYNIGYIRSVLRKNTSKSIR
jgi:membrane associated rhomboid family serine protease